MLLAGCANLQPQGARVDRTAAEALAGAERFSAEPPAGAPAPTAADLQWWERFDDPALAGWVERALAANLEIAATAERTQQARALLREARANRLPQLVAQGELEWRLRGAGSGERSDRRLQPSAALALDVDLDPWGGLRAAQRAAAAGLLRSEELVHAARLAAAALAARAYLEWQLALHDQAVLQDTAALLREALRIVTVRVEAGISPLLDRDRAQTELASTEAQLAAAAVRAGQALAALQVAAGAPPRPGPLALTVAGGAPANAQPPRPLPSLAGRQPVVQPLDLLRLRPDLRAAEQALYVAAAEVGVAEAALLPRLRLPGVVALGATSSGAVFGLASATLAALLEATLFDGGARDARLDAARSRAREAEVAWRQAVQTALQQVEAALLARQGALARIESGTRARQAARAAQAQAETLYRVGLTNYLDVADAQRGALAAQRLLLQAQADAAVASVGVFEAMGVMPGR
jgi:NodT family efflux transporter outer membrane factor (OMF) lipoprotein